MFVISRACVLALSLVVLALSGGCAHRGGGGEEAPVAVPREFRAMWIATVANIDWPRSRGAATEVQKAELIEHLDTAVRLNMNAVIFQIRPHADALYASELEPWSEYLTGASGKAPDPYWDPLAFAIEESHRRGLELHAWFNPYRAWHPSGKSEPAELHVSKSKPGMVQRYGDYLWMDPGDPRVQAHSLAVIEDVVRRYDVDGIHYDDYFYPYPIRDEDGELVPFPDSVSYASYRNRGGKLDRDDFRRGEVDRFVRAIYESVKRIDRRVKVGISPFGIWRPGNPPQIKGFDQYAQLYADARRWLIEGWCDYFTPQLYWPIAKPEQSYVALLGWWVEQNFSRRHLWPGNATYRVADGTSRATLASEIDHQIAWTRILGAGGNVHFSAKALRDDAGGVAELLRTKSYAELALVPPSPWLDDEEPEAPRVSATDSGDLEVAADPSDDDVTGFLVYTLTDAGWSVARAPGSPATVRPLEGASMLRVAALDRTGNEGPCITVVLGFADAPDVDPR